MTMTHQLAIRLRTGLQVMDPTTHNEGEGTGHRWNFSHSQFLCATLLDTVLNKKRSCRLDSRPYWLTAPSGVTWRNRWRDLL